MFLPFIAAVLSNRAQKTLTKSAILNVCTSHTVHVEQLINIFGRLSPSFNATIESLSLAPSLRLTTANLWSSADPLGHRRWRLEPRGAVQNQHVFV